MSATGDCPLPSFSWGGIYVGAQVPSQHHGRHLLVRHLSTVTFITIAIVSPGYGIDTLCQHLFFFFFMPASSKRSHSPWFLDLLSSEIFWWHPLGIDNNFWFASLHLAGFCAFLGVCKNSAFLSTSSESFTFLNGLGESCCDYQRLSSPAPRTAISIYF